jgi:hypothetical protein
MLQMINWEEILILHLNKYGSAFTSSLGRYSILGETATFISMLEESVPNLMMEAKYSFETSVITYKTT